MAESEEKNDAEAPSDAVTVPPETAVKHEERPPKPEEEVKKPEAHQPAPKADVPVDQETFTPPPARKSIPRSSLMPGSRRYSGPGERSLRDVRKSRFGALSSRARMVLGSIVDIKTNAAEYYDKKTARYQNTYKLESENPFNPEKVDKILREVMEEALDNLQYDPDKCASMAKQVSMQIRSKVKQLDFDRYKLVCIVSIGEKNSQDVYATCRFLWDSEKDKYAFYSMENTHVYAIAYCFGLYYE